MQHNFLNNVVTLSSTAVPEPPMISLLLIGLGLIGLLAAKRQVAGDGSA